MDKIDYQGRNDVGEDHLLVNCSIAFNPFRPL